MNRVELKANHLIKIKPNDFYGISKTTYIEQYLTSLGIKKEDIPSFIDRPRNSDLDDPMKLKNVRLAAEKTWQLMTKGVKVFVIVDSDTDGYTSSAILINYLKRRWPEADIGFYLHPGKEHGIPIEEVPNDCTLVFVPDAGSNDITQQEELVAAGKTVIILDHHEVEQETNTGAIVVNNQISPAFTNKYMSGAGIVLMFIMTMDQMFWPSQEIFRDYFDLAAIGIIADAMNMTALGNNYLAFHGLRNIKNEFIQEVAKRQSHGIKNPKALTKIDVAFYIAPIINGVIRSGSAEDKEYTFKAMSTKNCEKNYISVYRGNERNETLYQYAARLATNAKSRQDSGKRKAFEWLCNKIREEELDKDNIIIVTLDDEDNKKVSPNLTGLIAMELVREFNKPSLVLRKTDFEGEEVYGGSGRNGSFYGLPDLKDFLQSIPVYAARGHANAFGAFLLPDEVQKVRDIANTRLNPEAFDSVYEVDYIFQNRYDIDLEMLYQMASYEDLWGNSIPQPKFAFKIDYGKTDIFIMGKDRSSVKLRCGEVDFVSFKNTPLVQQLLETPNGSARIVGRPQLNEWNGNVSIQIMIDDIVIEKRDAVDQKPCNLLDLI